MKLFKKNKETQGQEAGTSAATANMSLPKKKIDKKNIESISQTTKAMNIVLSSANETGENESSAQARELISKNYDLAIRKIVSSYEDIIESGSYITTKYLAVQVSLYLHEMNLNPKEIHESIRKYFDEVWDTVSRGQSVAFTTEIVFEPIVYIDRIIPAVTITPSIASKVNTIMFDDLFQKLAREGKMSLADKEVIDVMVKALSTNIQQGYYVQIGRPILLKLRIGSEENMLLFSKEDTAWFNKNLSARKTRQKSSKKNKDQVVFSDAVTHLDSTKKRMDRNIRDDEYKKTEQTQQEARLKAMSELEGKEETVVVEKTKTVKTIEKVVSNNETITSNEADIKDDKKSKKDKKAKKVKEPKESKKEKEVKEPKKAKKAKEAKPDKKTKKDKK